MPPINANVTNQQITASVGETQIDVSVSGGVGPTGTPGAAASVQVGTVTTGAPGSSASVVNAGTSSAAVLNFVIPAGATGAQGERGLQGERGEQGIQGIQGIQGPAGATGATGPAGSNATATTDASALVSGTLPDARLSANIARTSDVTTAVANVVNAAPAALDTLNELAAALGNDASFATTVTNSLAGKANVSHTHTVSAITDAGTAATRNVPATGNAGATEVVLGSDTRLADSRTPTSHTHGGISNFGTISDQISTAQANPVAFAGLTGLIGRGAWGTTSGTFCQGNDSRLSDARTPTAHTQAWTTITATPTTLSGYGITDAVASSDARLTDARTPLAHNQAWSTITSTPTTLAGYGITDGATQSHTHSAQDVVGLEAALAGKASTTDVRLAVNYPVRAYVIGGAFFLNNSNGSYFGAFPITWPSATYGDLTLATTVNYPTATVAVDLTANKDALLAAYPGRVIASASLEAVLVDADNKIVGWGNTTSTGAAGPTNGTGGWLMTLTIGEFPVVADANKNSWVRTDSSGSFANHPSIIFNNVPAWNVVGSPLVNFTGWVLPDATTSTKGGVIVGTGLGVSSGTVSVTYGTTSGTACQGNDARLSDQRTPTDGSVTTAKLADSAVTLQKLSATGTPSATTFLRGDGQWQAPSGGGGNTNEIFHPFLLGGM